MNIPALYWIHAQVLNNEVNLPNKSGLGSTSVQNGLRLVFGIAGAASLVVIAYGALKYVLSQGNPQETAKAKDTILNAIIGLVVCLSAVGIISFVMERL